MNTEWFTLLLGARAGSEGLVPSNVRGSEGWERGPLALERAWERGHLALERANGQQMSSVARLQISLCQSRIFGLNASTM